MLNDVSAHKRQRATTKEQYANLNFTQPVSLPLRLNDITIK